MSLCVGWDQRGMYGKQSVEVAGGKRGRIGVRERSG